MVLLKNDLNNISLIHSKLQRQEAKQNNGKVN